MGVCIVLQSEPRLFREPEPGEAFISTNCLVYPMEHYDLYAASSPAELARTQEVLDQAVLYTTKAQQAEHQGRLHDAVCQYKLALDIKIRVGGEASVQAAMTYNELGECYPRQQNLDAAEQALMKTLKVRDDVAFGGTGQGPRY